MNIPEYMRVRLYLYNLMAKSNGNELQIPSENDLCRLFDVSRNTVRGAIQGMVRDKYLIPRRGIGTFMNPERIGQGVRNTPTVGIIIADGRKVTNPVDLPIANGILRSGMKFEPLFLPDSDSPDRLMEVVKSGVDAVIWVGTGYSAENRKYIDMLQTTNIPLLAIEADCQTPDNIDCIVSDPAKRGTLLAEYLFAHGHSKMLFVHNNPRAKLNDILSKNSPHHNYCVKMRELAKISEEDTGIVSLLELEETLRTTPDFIRHFSVIYSVTEVAPYVMQILNLAGIAVPATISYLIYGKSDPYFFHGLNPDYIDDETMLSRAVSEWLDLRLHQNCRDGRFERQLMMEIIPGETLAANTDAGNFSRH